MVPRYFILWEAQAKENEAFNTVSLLSGMDTFSASDLFILTL